MSSQIVFCIDVSGSTANCTAYWDAVKKVAEETMTLNPNENVRFLLWDISVRRLNFEEVIEQCNSKRGYDGTEPYVFASNDFLPEGTHVIIFTDGQVGQSSVTKCDNILSSRYFSSVKVYFVASPSSINLSVSTPFTRNTKHVEIWVNGAMLSSGDSSISIDISAYFDNPSKFFTDCEILLRQIVLQNMGINNVELVRQLKSLEKNLIEHIENSCDNLSYKISRSYRVKLVIDDMISECNGTSGFNFKSLEPGRLIAYELFEVAGLHNMTVQKVSWEDCKRGWDTNGKLSVGGDNIADVRILDKQRRPIYSLRPCNWNEELAIVKLSDLALVVGNEEKTSIKAIRPITASSFLKNIGKFGEYAGVHLSTDLTSKLDDVVSVRFQTVFIPSDTDFTTSIFSHGTKTDFDPNNLLLYCTSQGTSICQDRPGEQKLFHHMVDDQGYVTQHWLKASSSEIKVGDDQVETEETKRKALAENKAVAQYIGVKQMGIQIVRFNCNS